MADNHVGSIVIDAKMDKKDFMTNSKDVARAISSMKSTVAQTGKAMKSSAAGYGTAMRQVLAASRQVNTQMREVGKQADDLKRRLDRLGQSKVATDEFKKVAKDIDATEKKYAELTKLKDAYLEYGDDKSANAALEQLGKLEIKLELLKQKRDDLLNGGKASIAGSDTQEFQDMQKQWDALQGKIREYEQYKNEALKPPYMQSWEKMVTLTGMIGEGFGRIQNAASGALYALTHPFQTLNRALGAVISTVGRAVAALGKMAGNAAINFIKRLASEARNAAIQLAKLAANAVSSGLKKIAAWAGKAAQGVIGLNKANRRTNSGLGTSLKMILKYAFGIRSMFFLFRRLRSAISDGFGELKKQNPEVKAALDSLSQSLNGLKGSLAAAFAPILTAVAPALTLLINMLASALNTIGAFFAALTGKNTVAKSIGKIGAAAGKAGGKAKELKRELAGFDELTILEDKDSSGGGGGGSGGGLSYKTENIDSNIKAFADRVREMWAAGDYEGVGNEIAAFINKGFEYAEKFVTWDNLESKVQTGIDAVVGVFNGLVDPKKGINFYRIGATISAGIDSLLHIFNRLLDPEEGLNIEAAGRGLARALNGLFGNTSMWSQAGILVANMIRAHIRFAHAFLQEFNEGNVANGIRTALTNIPWSDIASATWDTIKLAFNKAGNFLNVLLGGTDFGASVGNDARAQMEQMSAGITPMIANGVSYDGLWDELPKRAGDALAKALNAMIKFALPDEGGIGVVFSNAVKKTFDFVGALLEGFNEEDAASRLKDFVENKIDWDGIAKAAWDTFKLAVQKLGNFLTVLFGGEVDVDAQNSVDAAEQMWKRHSGGNSTADKASVGTFGGLAQSLSTALKDGLNGLKDIIESVDWKDVGAKIGEFIADVDWGGLAEAVFNVFAEALSGINDLLSGVDDSLSKKFWGDNYKEDIWWQVTHPLKAAKYADEQREKWRADNPEMAAVLDERGKSTVSGLIGFLQEPFIAGKKFDTFGDLLLDYADRAKQIQEENVQAATLAQAANMVMKEQGISADEALQRYIDSGVDPTILNLVAAAIGANTDLLAQVKVAEEANTAANESNTTAIDANTTETASTPEQPEKPDVIGDLLNHFLAEAEKNKEQDTTYASQEEMDAAFSEVFKMGAQTWGESFKEAWDAGYVNEDWAEMMKSAQAMVEAGKTNEEIIASLAEADRPAQIEALTTALDTLRQSIDENGGTTHKGAPRRSTENPARKVHDGAQERAREITEDTLKTEKQQTKATNKLSKAFKKGLTAEGDIDVTVQGANAELLNSDTPTVIPVKVAVSPEGEEPTDDNTNSGLLGWLQALLDPGVNVQTKVELVKQGWTNFWDFIGSLTNNPLIKTAIELIKQGGWTTFLGLLGINTFDPAVNGTVNQKTQSGWQTFLGLIGLGSLSPVVDSTIKQSKQKGWQTFLGLIGLSSLTPTVSSTINQKTQNGWKTLFGLLGISTANPVIETVVKLLKGAFDGTAQKALEAAGQQLSASVSVGVKQVGGTISKVTEGIINIISGGKTSTDANVNVKATKTKGDQTAENTVNADGTTKTVTVYPVRKAGDKTAENTVNAGDTTKTVTVYPVRKPGDKTAENTVNAGGTTKDVTIQAKDSTNSDVAAVNLINADKLTKSVTVKAEAGDGIASIGKGNALNTLNGFNWVKTRLNLYGGTGVAENGLSESGGLNTLNGFNWVLTRLNLDGGTGIAGLAGPGGLNNLNGFNWVKTRLNLSKGTGVGGLGEDGKNNDLNPFNDEEVKISGKAGTGMKKFGSTNTMNSFGGQTVTVSLSNAGTNWAKGVLSWITNGENAITATLNLAAGTVTGFVATIANALLKKNALGGIISSTGKVTRFANGGAIMNSGRASWWDSANKYAAGTSRAHGTVFVAGEAGPEIMGHVNGKTEILNKSQLADAIYGAVVSGMAKAVNALGSYLANHMSQCTNAIVSTIGATTQLSAIHGLDYYAPAMATGGIMPYDVSAQIARSTTALQGTLDANNEDLIQAMVSAIGNASMAIVSAIQAQVRNSGGSNITTQQIINEINRQGIMYGRTPIKGV